MRLNFIKKLVKSNFRLKKKKIKVNNKNINVVLED